jgi:hypothetical protein
MVETIAQVLAALCASLFAGSALYSGLVESRTALGLAAEDPATYFVRGFCSSGTFQAPLVLVGTVAALVAATFTGSSLWIAGAALMALVIVVTAVLIFPLNARLLHPAKHPNTRDQRGLVVRWYRLHAVRGLLALAASSLYLFALVQAR